METVVTTREELKKAKEEGKKVIIAKGELADNLKKAKKITTIGSVGLGILTAALVVIPVTAPATGGMSFFVAVPIATLTGMEVATIIAVSAIGVDLVMTIYKNYDVEILETSIKFTRKQR